MFGKSHPQGVSEAAEQPSGSISDQKARHKKIEEVLILTADILHQGEIQWKKIPQKYSIKQGIKGYEYLEIEVPKKFHAQYWGEYRDHMKDGVGSYDEEFVPEGKDWYSGDMCYFTGQWVEDKANGPGHLFSGERETTATLAGEPRRTEYYIGEFKNGELNGLGSIERNIPDKRTQNHYFVSTTYYGEVSANRPNGIGREYDNSPYHDSNYVATGVDKNIEYRDGIWRDGVLIEQWRQ